MGRRAGRLWRRARSYPRSTLAVIAVLVVAVSLVAVGTPPQSRGAVPGGATATEAKAKAKPKPKIGELPERATAASTTRRNKDGSLTTTVYSGPVNFRDANGTMRRIDSALYPLNEAGYAWRSGANRFEARFGAVAGGDVVELRIGGRTVRMRAEGAAAKQAVRSGSQVSYPGAFPSADLRYQVSAGGVKETIDLAGPDAPTSFSFRLSPADTKPGLSVQRRADGSYAVIAPPLAGAAFVLAPPVVQESAREHEIAAPDPAAKPGMRITQSGRDLLVTLSLDQTWLRAPGRHFPVHLDPTMSIQPDTMDASFITNSAYLPFVGDRIYIGGDSSNVWRGALTFDLGGLPVDARVTDAKLGLYFDGWCISTTNTPFCGGIDHPMDAHRMTAAWSTSSTTGQLAYDPTPSGSFTLPASLPGGWMTWPITTTVNNWVTGAQPNYGLFVKPHTEVVNSSGPVPPSRTFTGSPTLQPKIDVTYTSDAVDLADPATLHGNGADLSWTQYTGPSGAPFDRYEIHRKLGTASFTPDSTTLVATIRDPSITTYRDTTAAPNTTFTYRVVANSSASNPRTVTLPGAGQASKVLQPDPVAGRDTYLYYASGITNCLSYGKDTNAWVGTTTDAKWRNVLSFDLRDIPAGATITNATASLWQNSGPGVAMSVEAHRITRSWKEGVGGECNGDAANWYQAQAGTAWTSQGGDIDANVAAKIDLAAGAPQGFHDFTITNVVQGWVNGTTPNYGILLQATDETLKSGNSVIYLTDDYTASPTLRPKLSVSYSDGSVSYAPTVSVSAPTAGAVVRGSPVRLSAAAADDGKLSKVELRVDGAVVSTLTAAPWQYDWNSTSVTNGTHVISATAYDDAGRSTTSAGVSVTVDNAGAPTGTVSAAASTTPGTWNLSATATPAGSKTISSVSFLVDGVRVGNPVTGAPYSYAWDSLKPLAPGYNGAHQVTAAITDSAGQVGVTPPVTVTVNNTGSTTYRADFNLNNPSDPTDDAFPATMTENTATGVPLQDPYSGTNARADGTSGGSLNRALADPPHDDMGSPPGSCPVNAYCPKVNVSNASGVSWSGSQAQVWYRWYAPNGAIMYEGKSATAFPSNFGKNGSQSFPLTIYPPALPPGVAQGTFRLRIDVFDPASGTWFSSKGNPPVDNPVIVAKSLATKLGLERYYQYDGGALGAGMSTLSNLANGNMLLRWSPFFAPGRGLSTMVDLTYNSLEDHSSSAVGNNFSLSVSGLARLGEPIDIHPNKADTISGRANRWIEVTDGDGSTHHFDGVIGTDGVIRWTEPAGVNLYLRAVGGTDTNRVWAFTRPDKVTYYFDADGFPTSVEDRNGNRITYVYEETPSGEDPGGPKKRVIKVTDAGGRDFTVAYWSKAEAKKAHVRGKVKTITDHSDSTLSFDYYDDGNLLRLTQDGGTNADGSALPGRSFLFTYTTSNGAGPAIGADGDAGAAARQTPDAKTANQSTRVYSVADPRGNETRFAYYQATDGAQLRWKLKSRTDRHALNSTAPVTGYGYDLINRVTTVTDPLTHDTKYTYDTSGRVTSIVDPANLTTSAVWSADNKVIKVTEPSGKFATYTYNDNGYLKTKTDQLQHTTELTYVDSPVDANDLGRHLSRLDTVTTANGTATPTVAGDYMTSFTYDTAGNPDKVTVRVDAQTVAVTDYDYNLPGSANPGTLAAVHDANGNPPTTYPSYDPSGQPTQIVDPLGRSTRISYNPDGNVVWIQDPNHANDSGTDVRSYRSYFDYDTFGRLGRQSAPKSTAIERGKLLWSSSAFDPNDNVVRSTEAHFGQGTGDPGGGATTTTGYDVMDRTTLVTGPDTKADPAGERTKIDYDLAGRTIKVTKPRGVQTATTDDFATTYGYDVLDRAVKQTEFGTSTAQARVTQLCYDTAGDLRSITSPRAGTATITCPGNGPAVAGFTTELDYDDAHRQVTKRDELGHEQRTEYDANGNAIAREADITTGRVNRTEVDYDQRDKPITQRERFDGTTGRNATTKFQYDLNGNRTRVISPRAFDTGGPNGPYTFYVTVNDYDAANQLVRTTLPFDGSDGTERQYVHRSYDANGNLASSSLPVTQPNATLVGAGAKTTMTYFDPGWVRTSDDPANPAMHFDYTATGQQSQRTPELKSAPGTLDTGRTMTWTFYADDLVESRSDQGGQAARYFYDADNNLASSTDSGGVTDPSEHALETQSTYTGFDEVAKTRHRKQTSTVWKFTDYTYDDNGNTTVRRENGEENDAGTQSTAPRRYELTYDGADWLTEQRDLGTDSACLNDTRTVNAFWGTGLEKQRDTYRAGATCTADPATWTKKQTTTWTHFDNGKLRTLTTKTGAGTITETHTVSYFDTATNVYVNGNRTKDTQGLVRGAGSSATTCTPASPCDAVYIYDARDKVLSEARGGKTTTYKLDEPAGQLGDNTIRAGNVTTRIANGVTATQRYTGNQLTDVTAGGTTVKYWYDDQGNQDCITTAAGSQANCNTPSPTAAVLVDYTYDYLNRLLSLRQFSGGAQTDKSSYVYDALDRTTIETEDHAGSGNDRKTDFTYQGLSLLLTEEKQSGGTAPKTKAYSYDNFGHRLGMTDTDNGTGAVNSYSYGTDVHGSISQLIDDAGSVKASYGYSAYGGADSPSTDAQSMTSGDTNAQAPINPMRYSGKRIDSGTASSAAAQPDYDMGARRYGPSTGRFLQVDAFAGALGDLGLALDPLTQNRYALAGGNPISYVETDGHMAIADGGGGGSTTPAPPPPPPEPSLKEKAKNLLGGLWNKGKDKVEDTFKDVKDALDELDAKTVDNPDWKLHGIYEGWKKFEEKAEPIVGATDVYNCVKSGQGGSCAWAAAAFIPGSGLGKGALNAALRTSLGKKALMRGAEFLARRLPVSTGVDKAVFYSGAGMQDKALKFASSMAKTPIDKTIGGRVLEKLNLFDHLSYPEARRPWEMMSQRYAEQASGDVSAFVSSATSGTGIFAQTELPALIDNPAVKTINGASKDFFEHWFGGLIS